MMQSMLETGLGAPKANGWIFPPNTLGRAMIINDFKTLSIQSLGGIISNDPKEAVYINTQAPLGAVITLRVVNSILNLKDSAVAWNEARVTRKVLSRLSAEQLEDIGLSRADLF